MANQTPRIFEFTPTFSLPVPENVPARAKQSNALPFPDLFTSVEDKAANNEAPHFFIPTAFWHSRPSIKAENVTEGWMKAKLRDAFNKWRDETATTPPQKDAKGNIVVPAVNEKRGRFMLIALARTGKEGIEGIEEPGISIWLALTPKDKEAYLTAKAEAEKAAAVEPAKGKTK